jgi:hypothetical protein
MTRSSFTFSAAAALLAVGFFGGALVQAQQQQQPGQQSAIGTASVRTREGAPAIQLTNQQTPLITVAFGPQQQQSELQVTALVTSPDQPQQDKEIVFNRAAAQHRIVAFEGDATGSQNRRLLLTAARGQDNAIIEPIAQNEAVQVFGIRKAEPKVAQQQPQQPQQGAQAQPGQPQQAAAQQPPQQTAEQAAAAQKQAAEEAKRKAAEPKPDKYDAIVTVFLTTGR